MLYTLNVNNRLSDKGFTEHTAETPHDFGKAIHAHYFQNHPHLSIKAFSGAKMPGGVYLMEVKLTTEKGREMVDRITFVPKWQD